MEGHAAWALYWIGAPKLAGKGIRVATVWFWRSVEKSIEYIL